PATAPRARRRACRPRRATSRTRHRRRPRRGTGLHSSGIASRPCVILTHGATRHGPGRAGVARVTAMSDADNSREVPDRNMALELVRVTEAAAMAAARWVGRGEKDGADGAAVDAMRLVLETVP